MCCALGACIFQILVLFPLQPRTNEIISQAKGQLSWPQVIAVQLKNSHPESEGRKDHLDSNYYINMISIHMYMYIYIYILISCPYVYTRIWRQSLQAVSTRSQSPVFSKVPSLSQVCMQLSICASAARCTTASTKVAVELVLALRLYSARSRQNAHVKASSNVFLCVPFLSCGLCGITIAVCAGHFAMGSCTSESNCPRVHVRIQ